MAEQKEYTTLEEKLNLEEGFNGRNSAAFVKACRVYAEHYNPMREVIFSSLSCEENFEANGLKIMDLLVLEAYSGSTLRIKVEGTDNDAKEFSAELKKGLNEEMYLAKRFAKPYWN